LEKYPVSYIKLLAMIFFMAFAADAWSAVCTMKTTSVGFGAYNVYSPAPTDGVGYIYVTCDASGVPFTVRLDAGTHSGGVFVPRKMKNKSSDFFINYDLYLDSARTQSWGDGSGNTFIQNGESTADTITLNVYGRVLGRQNVSAGDYGDSVAATLMW
jgi:spore coat protein U domain-containing protein, fimbrial subunit CupE1/2/3/6